MIQINAFWFGYFLGLLTVVFLIVVVGLISIRNHEQEEKPEIRELELPEELQKAIVEEIMKQERGDKNDGI